MLDQLLKDIKGQLEYYTGIELGENAVLDLKLKALVLDSIHRISIIEELVEHDVRSNMDWHWQKQLR